MTPDKQLLLIVGVFGFVIFYQESNFGLSLARPRLERDSAWVMSKALPKMPPTRSKGKVESRKGMAACLMVRDDNSLLNEWIAYHYQILPLRHVLVAADQGSTENPRVVLERWNETDLKFTVWNHTDFIHRFGAIPVGEEDQNHHYLHRQRAFITSCAEYMKSRKESWVFFVDTDEFVVINRINNDDTPFFEEEMDHNSTRYHRFQQRRAIVGSTVMEAIETSCQVAPLDPCHVLPRLLISALENETCPEMDHVKDMIAAKDFDYAQLSSIRFVQTAPKNTFYPSKWGKVMVDVSRMSDASLAKKPKSAHRPFVECPKPLRLFEEAIIHANHYLGSWERYSARKDTRRSRKAFEQRAYFSHHLACEMHMERWFLDFVDRFGTWRSKFLLGLS